jgi:hypothetical protein
MLFTAGNSVLASLGNYPHNIFTGGISLMDTNRLQHCYSAARR